MTDTILVDAGDVQSANRLLQDWEGVLDAPEFRGSNIEIPYSHGELAVGKYRAAKPVTLFMVVMGTTTAGLQAELEALYALLPMLPASPADAVDTTCVLTRRLGGVDTDADAEYIGGADPHFDTQHLTARLTLRFRLLTGTWG